MVELLPCPFCGGPATMEQAESNRWSAGCSSDTEPLCMGYQSLTTFERQWEAARAWNTRNSLQVVTVTADWSKPRQGSTAMEPTLVFTHAAIKSVEPEPVRDAQGSLTSGAEPIAEWTILDVERALYVDRGRDVILCDRDIVGTDGGTLLVKLRLAAQCAPQPSGDQVALHTVEDTISKHCYLGEPGQHEQIKAAAAAVHALYAQPVNQCHGEPVAPADPDMPDLRLCSFKYLADEMRRRGATVMPAPHGGDFCNG